MPRTARHASSGVMHGVQLWVAQPEKSRNGLPTFEHHAELPVVDLGDGEATVLIGEFAGARSAARADTPLVGVDLAVDGMLETTVELTFEYGVVVLSGTVEIDATPIGADELGYLGIGRNELRITSGAPARLLLLGGAPFEDSILMWWNFVAGRVMRSKRPIWSGRRAHRGSVRFSRRSIRCRHLARPGWHDQRRNRSVAPDPGSAGPDSVRGMKYVNLGGTGLRVSRVCLGMMSFGKHPDRAWALDEDEAEPIVRAAVDGGVTFFDTADTYSHGASEEVTGRLLGKLLTRDEVVVATKVFMPMTPGENGGGLSRKHILSAIDASLSRLGMDYVDLYQIHRWDPRTPIEETMGALHEVVQAGKARYIGASSMFAWQFAKAQHVADTHGWTRFVSMQNHYNLIYREEEREMMPLCIDQGVGVIPWSPLARGMLAGNRTREGERRTTRSETDAFADFLYTHPVDFDIVDRVSEIAVRTRRVDGAGRTCVAHRQAGRHRPDRGCDQAAASRGCARRGTNRTVGRRGETPRGPVRAARGRRALLAARSRVTGPHRGTCAGVLPSTLPMNGG